MKDFSLTEFIFRESTLFVLIMLAGLNVVINNEDSAFPLWYHVMTFFVYLTTYIYVKGKNKDTNT